MRWAGALLATGGLVLGCGGPSPLGSIDGGASVDAFRAADAGTDAGMDAGPPDAGPPPPGDTCADAIDAATGTTGTDGVLRVPITLIASHDDVETCDMPGTVESGDVVVRYVPSVRGRLVVGLETVGAPALFSYDVRTECAAIASSLACDRCGTTCAGRLDDVAAGTPLFVVVTRILSAPAGSGLANVTFDLDPFALSGEACGPMTSDPRCTPGLSCQQRLGETPICGTVSCGDGYVGFTTLECDDGNTTPGDGCSASCVIDMQADGGASCASATTLGLVPARVGSTLELWGAAAGTVVTGSDDARASCASASGDEASYAFTLPVRAHVQISATGADVVSVHDAGCGTERLCTTTGAPASFDASVDLDPGSYEILLDRTTPSATTDGTYTVIVRATPLP